MPSHILVVDDDEIIRDFFVTFLAGRGEAAETACDGVEALDALDRAPFDLLITDVKMPRMDGLELLRRSLGAHPLLPVVVLTAFATVENAVESMRTGAYDYIAKPITDLTRLETTIKRALEHRRLLVENQQLRSLLGGGSNFDQMVGPGKQMQRIFKVIESVAPTNSTVLITGESGSGKELVARAIHSRSARSSGSFVTVNCAAVPEGLIESELFGHEKGSFTGAFKTTKGKFIAASGGTLLLDEIGDMPLNLQAKLLRALEQGEVERVGSDEAVKVDVRVIATTNVDLEKAIAEGKFRRDLFYRLNVFPIKIPPLAERREDIPALAHHFLKRHAALHCKSVQRFSPSALNYLLHYDWPGNVRELTNTVDRAVVMAQSAQVELADFFAGEIPESWRGQETAGEAARVSPDPAPYEPLTLEALEKRHILTTLKALGGKRLKSAEQLDISIRTLRNKLNQYRAEGVKIDDDDGE